MDPSDAGPAVPSPQPGRAELRASDEDRRTTETLLGDAYAAGRLSYAEYRGRADQAWSVTYTADLQSLVADVQVHPGGHLTPRSTGHVPARVTGASSGPGLSLAVMSGQERSGRWTCPARHTVISTMGGVTLDLRHAVFESAETTITCICLMGGVSVIVPDDIDVEVNGLALMGGFGSSKELREVDRPAGGVRVRIAGVALMGGVDVTRKDEEED